MIKTEIYSEDLIKTYSDAGFKIMQESTGTIYDEAIDPISMNRTYTETNIPIEEPDESEPSTEAEEILDILLGENK